MFFFRREKVFCVKILRTKTLNNKDIGGPIGKPSLSLTGASLLLHLLLLLRPSKASRRRTKFARRISKRSKRRRRRRKREFFGLHFQTLLSGKKGDGARSKTQRVQKRKRDKKRNGGTSCNLKTNASMRSSMVPVWALLLLLLLLPGTHERLILLFAFPIVFGEKRQKL